MMTKKRIPLDTAISATAGLVYRMWRDGVISEDVREGVTSACVKVTSLTSVRDETVISDTTASEIQAAIAHMRDTRSDGKTPYGVAYIATLQTLMAYLKK